MADTAINRLLEDERLAWIRQKVVLALDIPLETFHEIYLDKIERARSASVNRELLQEFLTKKHGAGTSLFFSCKKWKEDIEFEEEVEETVEEVVEEAKEGLEGATPSSEAVVNASEDNNKAADGESKTEAAAVAPDNATAAATATDGAPTEGSAEAAVEAPKVKKMIKIKRTETVTKSLMSMSLDSITADMSDNSTVFFIRCFDGDVPQVNFSLDPFQLSSHLEFSVLSAGDVLSGIANMMNQLYLPVVMQDQSQPSAAGDESKNAVGDKDSAVDEGIAVDGAKSNSADSLRHELSSNLVKFEQQIRHVIQQSKGDVRLRIPTLTITSVQASAEDHDLVSEIESALEDWTKVVHAAVEGENQNISRAQNTPLGEIDFWRERQVNLSAIFDQINSSKIQQMLQVLKIVESSLLNSFNYYFAELTKLYLEAKDNVKFLSTLERHFKHLQSGSFQTIIESLPSMVNGLRMVWVISRHYNTDEYMAPLMECIAETLARRIRDEVRLSSILAMDYSSAKKIVQEAKDLLMQWSENYFRMRKRIEDSGSDHRWEFDRKALFGKTDYMSDICANIMEVIDALDYFRVFLGPELKAVTGDSAGIDDVIKRVEGLSSSFQIPFEEKIFDKSYEKPWEMTMKKFRSTVIEIERMTEQFIKESFRKLRSAEGAFDLVQNFQKIGSGSSSSSSSGGGAPNQTQAQGGGGGTTATMSIKQQISDRYNDILEQYLRELESIKQKFAANKDSPQLYKTYPPVAGAIAWARDLYQRAKRPIIRFKKHGGLLDDAFGDQVKAQYLKFARSVDTYINELFTDWETNIASTAVEYLLQPVLRSIATYNLQPAQAKSDKEAVQFILPPPPYRANLAHNLKMIIKESRYLDKLGFRIPESALNVTLQERKYQDIVRSLNEKLLDYDNIIASLKPVERFLLKAHIDDLNVTIKTGFTPLNWTSQRIPAYIEDLNLALVRFSSIVTQVHKSAQMVDEILKKISGMVLVQPRDFKQPDGTLQPLDVSEFYEILDNRRVARVEALVDEYNSIGDSFLLKVEEVVAKTATGASPVLAGYYSYWEKCIYNSIIRMIIQSMSALLVLLQGKESPPMFKLNVALNGKDLVITPSLTDIDKYITKAVRNLAESAKYFTRWMHSTCIRTQAQIVPDDDEPVIFTFYQDISQNPEVIKLNIKLTSNSNRVYSIANKYLEGWRRYDKVMGLWNPKRRQYIEKIRPTCANLDQFMSDFQKIKDSVETQPITKDVEFLHIDVANVSVGVAKQAEIWKNDYGEVLMTTSRAIFNGLRDRITKLEGEIQLETNDLESLKFVLNTIADISAMMLDVELEILDINERYRTLVRYNINVSSEELDSALNIDKRWRKLYVDSKTRDLRLIDTKLKFRLVTSEQDVQFRADLVELRKVFLDAGPGVSSVSLDQGIEMMQDYKRKMKKLNAYKADLTNAMTLFDIDIKPYSNLQQTQFELDQLDKIYSLYIQFKDFLEGMSSCLWQDLDMSALQRGAEDFEKAAKRFPKELKEIFTYKTVEARLVNFKEALPLVVSLKNDAMKTRHWQSLMDLTKVSFDTTLKSLRLGEIFSMELHQYTAQVEEIINEAQQEGKIETEITKIETAWKNNSLQVMKYKKDGQDRGWMLKQSEDLKLELEDNMLNMQTISSSRFVGIFVEKVRKWEKTLNLVSETLEVWYTVQRKWVYLEGIFIGAEDIRLQLPEEAKKFDAIDKAYKVIMVAVSKNPNVVDACTSDNKLQVLNSLSDRLDHCQKSLTDYLNTKRSSFPRFFFISDDELLSVLGSSDPTGIQVHLLKLFDNVKEIQFERGNTVITAMSSVEKEGFNFRTVSPVEGPVEVWMTKLEDEMHVSLTAITKEGVFMYAQHERCNWLKLVLGMVGLVGSQIWWTWEVEDSFRSVLAGNKYAMKELEQKLTHQLNDLVAMVRDKLDGITRIKVNTLLIVDVHARDIVDNFVRESVLNAKEFAWESQLRFYWDRDIDDCTIKQCTGKFRYGYEYMGLNGRLVITPLTDRCYMTLTQALTFKLGGSPAGPAGTGKTETVKDLAKSLALPCFVINCGDGLDYKAMGSIFSGLVQTGAWGCFDEFNRINIEVLSVVSAQLRSIQNALIYDKPSCDIGFGIDIYIKRVAGFAICGIFITMNPGYAGRTELPDNLKALFRPVTMIVPDFQMICEIMLFSEGFESAKFLAKKMTVLYGLSKSILSKQFHYDFGMRALKSVLVMAGGLKRQYSNMGEDLVLMRCLRDSNMPKFVFEDVPLFAGLINDLFPGMECPRVGYEDLKACCAVDLEAKGYKCSSEKVFAELIDKCIQMYETMLVRHTCMIVGPTGGGKSLVLETLKNGRLAAWNEVVKMYVLNPKAQPLKELYGEMDPVSRDWTDGILSKLFRECNDRLPPGKENEVRWILYDGDVDALWVENMNSVMDDNRLLTLPNSERIRLQPYCKMIMETFDLQYASPATISRCGMVWVDPKNLGFLPYYERWVRLRFGNGVVIEEAKQTQADFLMALFDKYIPKSIDLILSGIVDGEMGQKLRQVIPICNLDLVKQFCSVFDSFMPLDITENLDIEMTYIFSLIWSLGAAIVGEARKTYDSFVKRLARESLPDGLLYDYFYDLSTHKWEKWQSQVPAYVEPSPFRFYEVMVPTTDSVLYAFMLKKMAPLRPVLFVGDSGTAKTTIIQKYLNELPSQNYTRLNINFSSRTRSADVQTNIEANIDKRSGSIYGPPSGKKLIVFLDDLNMPKVDTYGTQQPITFLLYLMSRGGFYDRGKDLNLKTIKDLQYIGAMGPPGGGRNPVDTRFVALFNVFNLNPPTAAVLAGIFNAITNLRFREFADGVKAAAAKITECSLRLYNFVIDKMPPTPSKFHYIFNLRDLSRIYEGLCNATTDVITDDKMFIRLWRNECDRILFDRLASAEDQQTYRSEISKIIKEKYNNCYEVATQEPSMFGDFSGAVDRIANGAEDVRLYKDIGGYDEVRTLFNSVLDLYNGENKAMTLVLFENALEHLCRIHRIIRNVRGNALLVGVGGSGKQSLTRLAGYCAGYKLFQIVLSRGYGEDQFKEDLKELYKMLGQGEVMFMFTDAHVVQEGFLELLNNMLTTGMVPALYAQDEKDGLCNSVRAECKALGMIETPDNLWAYYVTKCRNNLHIVLAMSPSGTKLRIRCRNFPGLVSNCVIDWFFPWPADALQKVAGLFLADELSIPEEHRSNVVDHMVYTHQNITKAAARFAEELRRYYYVTPKNYLDFIANYKSQLAANGKRIRNSTKRLEGGLQKLIEAGAAVERMQVVLTEKKIVVDEKTIKVQALIAMIQEKTIAANASQEQATVKQKYAGEQAIIIAAEKAKADEALMEALPAVEAATAALANLDKNDLTELKAFTNPPKPVVALCMQLIILKPTGEKLEENWNDAKKMLSNTSLLQMLKTYPKDDLNAAQVKKVNKYFGEDLSLEKMATVSKAGFGLLTWVVAIMKYYEVAKNVTPLREKVKAMEKAQQQTETELGVLRDTLNKLAKELAELDVNYKAANEELSQLQQEAALMTKRLMAASKLIEGLSGERIRWSADVKKLDSQKFNLVGDCLLGSSFLSYLGAFTTDYRRDLIFNKFLVDANERKLPLSSGFTLEGLLTTDATVQGWVSRGLPADDHSVQNGIITTASSRFPLCIDPQQQAVGWIKKTYSGKSLTVKQLTQSDFMKHLELAIQFGNAFLFENIDEELDPMIDPILEKNIVKEGAAKVIKLGDKMVEWDDNFRLFFTTKLANPHYSPEVMGKTMIVNYGVTLDGLANQLLNVVVAHERPDLEKQWADLVQEMGENAQLLVSLEDTLLRELSSSSGNILDNQELILTLENTKQKAVEISGKMEVALQTKEDIGVARSVYKPVAKRGSILYFAEAGLVVINSMYEISLDSFLIVFKSALENAKKDSNLDNRLRNMTDTIMRLVYDYTCTGIFERHKLMFSFQMTCMILNGDDLLDWPCLDFFLKGDTSLEAVGEPSPATWLSGSCWKDLLCVSNIHEVFSALLKDFRANPGVWKDWYDLEAPETVSFPSGFSAKLAAQQKLAVMRCFRPDRVYNLVKLFVMETFGEKFVQPPVLDYNRIYLQSSCTAPMVFILSPGADPQSDIQKFCDEMGMAQRFKFVALGQGQGPIAEQLLDAGIKRGHWVLLQNCHLLVKWLKTLEKVLNEMKDPHKDFRLWLTTDPTDSFPLGILQRSVKVVTEPPDGLKLNMRSTFSKIDTAMLEECPHWAFRPCLYVLAFLHAVVLERRKYGKIGWNVNYDFNESDFNISRRLLSLYLTKAFDDKDEFLPWGSLKYLVGEAMYGGRVSDGMDRRILITYLEEYMGDFLFDDCQKFSFSHDGFEYELPAWGDLENYTNMIESLPLVNSPKVFGLHANAEIGYYSNAVRDMWLDLISLQPRRVASGEGMSREDYIATTARDVFKMVPLTSMDIGTYDMIQTRALLQKRNNSDEITPCQVVLLQEAERWNSLIKKMASSLQDLKRALVGEIGMSDELDALGDSLFNGFLPAMWRRLAPETQKPLGSWMLHYTDRHQVYERWIKEGEPAVMWLAGLHIPESYLTALVQTTCRVNVWPLDKSTLYTVVTKHVKPEGLAKLDSGSYVSGLYLEGAAWDFEKSVLRPQDPKVLIESLPIMQVIPVIAAQLKLHNTFRTPVYVTQNRRSAMGVGLVFEADLATSDHVSHWVLQGVCLCLNVAS